MIFRLLLCNKLVRLEENINVLFSENIHLLPVISIIAALSVKLKKKMERIFFSFKLVFLLRDIFINRNALLCKNIYIIALIFGHNNVSEIIDPYLFIIIITILLDWLFFNVWKQYLWLIVFHSLHDKLCNNTMKSKESKE